MRELDSNAEWKQWGKDDPLWAVATFPNKQKGGASPWTEEDFYSHGESDWQDFLVRWKQYGISLESCLEIGCGAGRITRQLSKTFGHVYAVDVSEHMIRCAQRAVNSGNVEFAVIDGISLPHRDCSVKAIFSTHVLQHLDTVDIGFSYFREFFRVLDAGGTAMIHVPLFQFPNDTGKTGLLMWSLNGLCRRYADVRSDVKRRLGVKMMNWTPYPIQHLRSFLSDLGFKNIEFRIFETKSNADPHPFVLATK